jgi:hypothetical protein
MQKMSASTCTAASNTLVPGELLALSCRSAVAYRDVGEGREQDAEASPARIAARRRSYNYIFCND